MPATPPMPLAHPAPIQQQLARALIAQVGAKQPNYASFFNLVQALGRGSAAGTPGGAPSPGAAGPLPSSGIAGLIAQQAQARGLDPAAVLAVARQEGLGGGIGDNGTSFGPFQLHIGGAFPTGRVPHGQEQAWAMSPQGIAYALNRIASVAKGRKGRDAIANIVTRFERPANPGREIANAVAVYGR